MSLQSFALFQKLVRRGELTVIDHKGERHIFGTGEPRAAIRLNTPSAFGVMARNPELKLGETYMDGLWDVAEGTLHDVLTLLRINLEAAIAGGGRWRPLRALLSSLNGIAASRRNASHHYDLDEPLFRACLDKTMHYSCAYFRDRGMTLEEAQHAKSEHIAAKLHLRPGHRVLDIGCGWGSLAMHLAEHHDVRVTGLTLSAEQLRVARETAAGRGLDNQVEFLLQDYREHPETYDRIVSVGMFEHVGKQNVQRFFDSVRGALTDKGVALLHTIGSKNPPEPVNPWIRRYIFPGGYIPSLSDIAPAVERAGLVTTDIEVLRRHYAFTLKEWNRRFQGARNRFVESKGERFCRMWEFYLVICQTAFEVGDLVVLQWQLARHNEAVPITRDYLYDDALSEPVSMQPRRVAGHH
ncbi:MAG: cyclopropane-fatty-acyl-phospholipid synthase [Gammaproteobacteria bacterium]|nr:cyclopropane-fatty-acyl-phospholipid synthase [Gammaproteobacteria bacterium]MDE0365987.1 cyclopropane-fatty-acyl-phospholipid synthase [Gammaproteobacteria bacterium]